jgi:hypothetical protein
MHQTIVELLKQYGIYDEFLRGGKVLVEIIEYHGGLKADDFDAVSLQGVFLKEFDPTVEPPADFSIYTMSIAGWERLKSKKEFALSLLGFKELADEVQQSQRKSL